MKALSQTIIAIMTMSWLNTGMAIPITANSGISFNNDMVIATGGQLPIGLESIDGPPSYSFLTNSSLYAPDAVDFDDTDIVIAGLTRDAPSTFSSISTSTRNAGTEGSISSNNTQLYQIRELEIIPDGSNDVSERGLWGNGVAQASLTTSVFDTRATSEVSFEREFTFSNQNAFAMTFGIQGVFEMDMFAIANGEHSVAEAFATLDMFFSSSNILDIQFADISPYSTNQTESGGNASISLIRETNVAGTGHLSLTGMASASGLDGGGAQQALGGSVMSYAIGITLQPGEEITMSHLVTYSNLAAIEQRVTEVNEPSSLLLMLFALGISIFRKQYSIEL
ncbi:hypothetical protein [uncultured Paraglaciecola sp.]|uniref:hypothetical protein n=1 Tax=uncultured Paraglaciecola sp. TaxID=1765024 RepID=UPI0030DDD8F8|tara:strand:+ start:11613 stop:12626 length:1014 start_codon:yes stop_codon:yes gene_type:complete